MTAPAARNYGRDALIAWAVVAVAVAGLVRINITVPAIGHLGSAMVAVLVLYVPVYYAWRRTEDLYHGNDTARVRKLPQDVVARALDKLTVLNFATSIQDLRSPPSNHLEELKGDRKGYHSIKVNKQWRLVFRWGNGAHDVELVDYH